MCLLVLVICELFAATLFMYVSQFCELSAFVLAMSTIHYDCD